MNYPLPEKIVLGTRTALLFLKCFALSFTETEERGSFFPPQKTIFMFLVYLWKIFSLSFASTHALMFSLILILTSILLFWVSKSFSFASKTETIHFVSFALIIIGLLGDTIGTRSRSCISFILWFVLCLLRVLFI